ncbi:MAG: leucyl aminopeptidase [Candidatus Sericytochromatia bacterium]|nr:leucyl aminopeptidase [Candidatus Sericytochromatia bacterium]
MTTSSHDPVTQVDDMLIVGFLEGVPPSADGKDPWSASLERVWKLGDFVGKEGTSVLLYPAEGPVARVLALGLGKSEGLDAEKIRHAAGEAVREARELGARRVLFSPLGAPAPVQWVDAAAWTLEGALLGAYTHDAFRTEDKEERKTLENISVAVPDELAQAAAPRLARARALADAVHWARTRINEPGNVLTAPAFAEAARELARTRPTLAVEILEKPELEASGCGALLGVNAGSEAPPRLIVVTYEGPGTEGSAPVALVGKGITFDTGGLCLKGRDNMGQMKDDMSGGAAVLGALRLAADLMLPVRLVAIVAATDNMPGAAALKPGDILKAHNGKTIEVIDTDAEGRLVLADALSYAVSRFKPRAVIDLATLTGSVWVALGTEATGLFTNQPALGEAIRTAGEAVGERCWPMPLWDEHEEFVKSDIADLKNSGGRGQSDGIMAAAMLKAFVHPVPWVHLDIAGTAWADETKGYRTKGGVGVGIRLLVEALERGLPNVA